jgi:hypothetical protein
MCQKVNCHIKLANTDKSVIISIAIQGVSPMIDTCRLHEDYENFAKSFLGIDYEDFVNMQYNLDDECYDIEFDNSLNY